MRGYFDQDFKTRFSKQTLASIPGFQWVVDDMEKEFNYPEEDAKTFDVFFSILAHYKDHVEYFIRIYKIDYSELNINNPFIKILSNIAKYSLKKISIKKVLDDNTYQNFTILYILGLLGGIVEEKKEAGYYNFGMFIYYNWFELNLINCMSKNNKKSIESLLNKLNIAESHLISDIYFKNYNNIRKKYNKRNLAFLKNNNNLFYNKVYKRNQFCTWQEDYILKMANIHFSITDIVTLFSSCYGNFPDYDIWNEFIIKNMKNFFAGENEAIKVLDIIDYKLHNVMLDDNLQKEVLNQCLRIIQTKKMARDYDNIWFNILIAYMNDKNSYIRKNIGSIFIALKKKRNYHILLFLKSKKFPMDKELKKKTNNYYMRKIKNIEKIENINELNDFIIDEYIKENINISILKNLKKTFYKIIEKNDDNLMVSCLFYNFMNFLVEIKGKVNYDLVNEYIFEMLREWQEKYYDKMHSLLQEHVYTTTIKNDEVRGYNEIFINNPVIALRSTFSWSEEKLLSQMVPISKHAVLTKMKPNTIYIDDFFPFYKRLETPEKDTLEYYICNYLDELQLKYEEQLLNSNLKPIEYYRSINDDYEHGVKWLVTFVSGENFQKMYNNIKESFLKYELLEYSEKITMAHITQLIPLLELLIRELGVKNKIVPFKEQKNEVHVMKDSTTILIAILKNAYKKNNNFEQVEIYLFLYNCFFNVHSLNIRNELIHAREYFDDEEKMKFAFRSLIIGIFWANIELFI